MHSTLLLIPTEVGGVPLFGFGLLLAVWAVLSVALMGWLLWRQGFTADTASYLPLLLIVGAAIAWVLPAIAEPGGLPVRSYGVMLLLAVLAGTGLATWRARRVGVDPDMIISLIFWIFVPGIVGARAFYVIEYWPDFHKETLAETVKAVINVTQGGLVVYGSLIGGLLGMIAFVVKYRLPLCAIADLMAPSLVLGLALGRIGCFLNGCCWGGECHLPWAVTFPAGSPPYQSQVARGQMWGFELRNLPGLPPVVKSVDPHSAASQAGLRPGDRLQSINGQPTRTTAEANSLLLRSFRDEQPLTFQTEDHRTIRLPAATATARSREVHPTQLYDSINGALLCLLLLAYDPFRRRDGELIALLLTVYPITRFLLESIRTDEPAIFGTGMSIGQNVSLAFLIVVAGLWAYLLKRPRGLAFAGD